MLVLRPLVRTFDRQEEARAARHVRAGGHAVVYSGERRARIYFQRPKRGDRSDLGAWAVYDFGGERWRIAKEGPFSGLAFASVPEEELWIVRKRTERDLGFRGATAKVQLDCLACGACCQANEVILERRDTQRFVRAGRKELLQKPYAKKKDGRVVLLLRKDKTCFHLGKDKKCAVYAFRPDACSTFPVGSECCLFAREEELGVVEQPRRIG